MFGKSSIVFGNSGNSPEKAQKYFADGFMRFFLHFRKIFGNLRKYSEIFGNLRKQFKSNFQVFLWFFKFSEIAEVFGNLRKFSDVIGNRPVHKLPGTF